MKFIYQVILYLCVSCLVSCVHPSVEKILAEAEAKVEQWPDSTLALLYHQPVDEWNAEQRARCALLMTQASHRMRKAGLFGDTLIDVAVDYYSQTDKPSRYQGRAFFYQGIRREFRGNIEGAVSSLLKARQALSFVDDPHFLGMTFERLGDIYYTQQLYERALDCYQKSYPYKLRTSKPSHQVWMLKNIATCHRLLQQTDSAEVYYQQVFSKLSLLDEDESSGIQLEYAAFLHEQKESEKANRLLTDLLPTLKDSTWKSKALYCLGCIAIDRRDYPRAEEYLHLASQSPDSTLQRSIYSLLAELTRVRKDYRQSVFYNRLHSIYDQQLQHRNRAIEVSELSWQEDTTAIHHEHLLKQQKSRWIVWLTVSVTLVVLLLIIHFFQQRKRKHDRQRAVLAKELETMKLQSIEERRTLRSRISLKERELQKIEKQYQENTNKLKGLNDTLKSSREELQQIEAENRILSKEKLQTNATLQELQESYDTLRTNYLRWEQCFNFLEQGGNNAAVLLLLQIQSNSSDRMRGMRIRRESYLPLLREYAEYLSPGIGTRMDDAALPANKQIVVCLLYAGITDNNLIAEAAALSPDTVRIYRKDLQRFLPEE